jgi:ADP-ribose pyrophosphatase YjhB (NUDIX family)
MKKYPNVAVVVILRFKDRILILKHKSGRFSFPGGRMEWKESILEALYRELKEELDYSLKKEPELFSVFNYISKNKKRHTVFIDYIYPLDKKPELFSPEKLEILWLTKRDLISKNINKDEKFLDRVFKYKRLSEI